MSNHISVLSNQNSDFNSRTHALSNEKDYLQRCLNQCSLIVTRSTQLLLMITVVIIINELTKRSGKISVPVPALLHLHFFVLREN